MQRKKEEEVQAARLKTMLSPRLPAMNEPDSPPAAADPDLESIDPDADPFYQRNPTDNM